MQFNAELNNTNERLAEEVEASADMVARSEKAERSMVEMALGLSVAVKACTAQKAARCSLKRKLEEKECFSAKMTRERDVANLQVQLPTCQASYAAIIGYLSVNSSYTNKCSQQRWVAQAQILTGVKCSPVTASLQVAGGLQSEADCRA